jgi:hypothetical protein
MIIFYNAYVNIIHKLLNIIVRISVLHKQRRSYIHKNKYTNVICANFFFSFRPLEAG